VNRDSKNSASVNRPHLASAGDDLDPAVRSWIDNCIVPNLVTEYLANLHGEKRLDVESGLMAEFRSTKQSSDGVTS
jgi:hypothetical protein